MTKTLPEILPANLPPILPPLAKKIAASYRKWQLRLAVLAFVAIAPIATAPIATAQTTPRIRDVNTNSWLVYAGDHPVGNGPWGVYVETQIRRTEFGSTWQQFQSRDALTYRFSPNIQVAAGYVFTRTARYGDFPAVRPFIEHRPYQQLTLKHAAKKLTFEHRYRVEQRFIETPEGDSSYYRYQNRFRYQFRSTYPIGPAKSWGQPWYLFAGDEIHIAFGPNYGPSPFDQNRAFAGIGYKVSPSNALEVGYLNQFLVQRNGRIEESNHTFRVQWTSTVRLFGKK
ncbi:MAG: DUF2490 domain-containing protein [Bryobacteraceae bacterium]